MHVHLKERASASYSRQNNAKKHPSSNANVRDEASVTSANVQNFPLTMEEVKKHTSRESCWFVLNGKVLDVTPFISTHPGGAAILVKNSGKDATAVFKAVGHSSYAEKELAKYTLGELKNVEMPKAKL